MKKTELNSKYREYVKNNLSPTGEEQKLVSKIYEAVKAALSNTLLVGSFARFTAGRPVHDLDVLFLAGRFDPNHLSPDTVLSQVQALIQRNFRNPTAYQMVITKQSHSVTMAFSANGKEIFGVDIVPAFSSGEKNSFGDDIYWVPEILLVGRRNRQARYEILAKAHKREVEWWIRTDPRGYITATTQINAANADFRKAAKFVKRWKHGCCKGSKDFKLKSFHIEQVLFGLFAKNPKMDIADAIFEFFCDIPKMIARPQVRDRADQARFIDEYVQQLTEPERDTIIQARDAFLIALENMSDAGDVGALLSAGFRKRKSDSEAYLFDSRIPVFLDGDRLLSVTGSVLPRQGSFRPFILDALGLITIDRKIQFRAKLANSLRYDLLKWKVKNDDATPEPRGEITDHSTRNDPESTKYRGAHYVECYAIRDGVCVARARQNVVLRTI